MKTEPFLKWPGGKRWLTARHANLFPDQFERYVEPFLGSGAVFFHLAPNKALLSDTNPELINAYKCIQRDATAIEKRLSTLHRNHSKTLYYEIRKARPRSPIGRAVQFVYLNRTCFNGIYRVNRAGRFNVPMGSKTEVAFHPGYLASVAALLKKAELRTADFESTLDETGKGDLVFVDPPYTVMHNNNNFLKYNAHLFSWEDQRRLASAVKRAARRGAHMILSNADHPSVRDLYEGFGRHLRLRRSTVLAAGSEHRCATTELVVTTVP